MDIGIDQHGDTAVLALTGELDANTAPILEGALHPLLDQGVVRLTVDLAGLDFLDSSGLRALVRTREQLLGKGGTIELRDPSPTIRRVLEITRLEEAFGLA